VGFWTEVTGEVSVPKNTNFSIKKSFADQLWEGHIHIKRLEDDDVYHHDYVSFLVRLDCYDMCMGLHKWIDTFPKGCKVSFVIDGEYRKQT